MAIVIMMVLRTDLLHVFLFIVVFIVIHIIVLHITDKRLSVNIRQRIVVDDGPVIKIRSLSRLRQRHQQRLADWEETNETVNTNFHLKYRVQSVQVVTEL